jgi:hypothetical protein
MLEGALTMPLDPTLPKHLQHLLEKRQGPGRRKLDDAESATTAAEQKLPTGSDRRKSNRRKSKSTKARK